MANWVDKFLHRVRSADSDEAAKKVLDEYIDPATGMAKKEDDDGDQHIHLHLEGKTARSPGSDEDETAPGAEADEGVEGILERLDALEQRLNELESREEEEVELEEPNSQDARRYMLRRGKKMRAPGKDEDIPVPERAPEMMGETDLPGTEDLDKRMAAGDKKGVIEIRKRWRSGDSADMEETWKDTMAAAAIIVPDMRVPTFDGRLTPARTAQRLCSFRRQVMDRAFKDAATAAVIKDVVNVDSIPPSVVCDTVKVAFNATAAALRQTRDGSVFRRNVEVKEREKTGDDKRTGTAMSLADINARNKAAWKDGKFTPLN